MYVHKYKKRFPSILSRKIGTRQSASRGRARASAGRLLDANPLTDLR